jgi:hypothetical protein
VACSTVAPLRASRADSPRPSIASWRLTSSMRAPTSSGRYSSRPAISNEIVVTAASTSCSPRPGSRAIERRKFSNAPCGTATPFGRPVEPEV